MSRLCAECGERAVEPRAVAGRTVPWRQFGALKIPAEFPIPTCTRCGAEWFDRKTSERLDAALGEAAAALQARLVCEAIEHLTETMSQRDLEHLLGLSAGYLSKIRHGKERPSAQLVSLLALLATRPRRLGELERLWETGRLPLRITDDNLTRVEVGVDATDAVAL